MTLEIEGAFSQQTLDALHRSRNLSILEQMIYSKERIGATIFAVCAVATVIPALWLIVNHLRTRLSVTPFHSLIEKYVARAEQFSIAQNQFASSSLEFRVAKYKLEKSCCTIVERIWHNNLRIGTEGRKREFLAASIHLIKETSVQKLSSDAPLVASLAARALEEEFWFYEHIPHWRSGRMSPMYPIKPA